MGFSGASVASKLRAYPEPTHTLSDITQRETPDLDEARREYFTFMEKLGDEAACELLALLYVGRDDEKDFQKRFLQVREAFEAAGSAASQIAGKGPALEYIAQGLAFVAGIPE